MEDLCHLQSQEACQRNFSLDIIGVYPQARSYISGKHDFKHLLWVQTTHGSHSTPAGFKRLVVDYIMFHFSGNSSAPHFPPSIKNLPGRQRRTRLLGVYRRVHESCWSSQRRLWDSTTEIGQIPASEAGVSESTQP